MEKAIIKEDCRIKLNGFEIGVPYEVFAISGGKVILINDAGDLLDLFPTYIQIVEK